MRGWRHLAPPLTKVRMCCSRATAGHRITVLEQTRMATACGTSNGGCDRSYMPRLGRGVCLGCVTVQSRDKGPAAA